MILSDDERRQLAATFGVQEAQLDKELAKFRAAAEEEYLRMILGQRVFTRGQDIREYRLFLLIVHAFEHQLPTEQQISALFQTTTTQSRSLLRAVMSKFQYELDDTIRTTLLRALEGSQENVNAPGGRLLTVDSENVIEALNRRVASLDGSLPQVAKLRGTVSTYEIPAATYQRLIQALS